MLSFSPGGLSAPEKLKDQPVTIYRVNEIFETLQGEGVWAGTPCTFIRMQGCLVGCPYCDTKHTWSAGVVKSTLLEAMQKKDSEECALMTAGQIVGYIRRHAHVVITGGEPCAQDLTQLIKDLRGRGKYVQIETSGTYEIPEADWVTLSPKINMPGGKDVLSRSYAMCHELKMVIGKLADLNRLQAIKDRCPPGVVISVQPMSQSDKATALCIAACLQHGYRLSLQLHKFVGVD